MRERIRQNAVALGFSVMAWCRVATTDSGRTAGFQKQEKSEMTKQLREWTAPDGREKVLAEFMPCGCEICKGCEERCQNVDGRTPQAEWMADEIVRLRAQLTRMACPVCGTVNPPEVHTCTPRPKLTVTNRWAVIDRTGKLYGTRYSTEEFALDDAKMYDRTARDFAPHTVKRVALIDTDTDTGEGEG